MTVGEVLERTDRLRPNGFDRPTKLLWLAEAEGHIYREIVCTHENPLNIPPPQIDGDVHPGYRLTAPFPYDNVYVLWMMCMIDLANMETAKYNNSRVLYNNAMLTLRDYWNRTFMPLDARFRQRRYECKCEALEGGI